MWLKAKLKPLESGWGFWVNRAKGTIFASLSYGHHGSVRGRAVTRSPRFDVERPHVTG